MTASRVAVVLAATDASQASEASVRAFYRQLGTGDRLILVGHYASGLATDLDQVCRISASHDALVPALWREGLEKVDADYVAFSTTQMVPCANWLDELLRRLQATAAAGVGGRICPADRLGLVDRAVYLQRFARYGRDELPRRPSGENALYRRDWLMEVKESWADGFWETEVQRAVELRLGRENGDELWLTATGVMVYFQGSTRLAGMLRQRIRHAKRYGAGRSVTWRPVRRLARLLTSPLVPGILLVRAFGHLGQMRKISPRWLLAIPQFLAIAGAWALGEAVGIAGSRVRTTAAVKTNL